MGIRRFEIREDFSRIQASRFPAPLAHLSSAPSGFEFHWMQIQFVFDLPDPYAFVQVEGLDEAEKVMLRRYVRNCLELAESSLLSYDVGLRIDQQDDRRTTELDIAPREVVRSAAVLFRLVGNDTDVGGFGRARKILEGHAALAGGGASFNRGARRAASSARGCSRAS